MHRVFAALAGIFFFVVTARAGASEPVRVLVPVPQVWYEPELLITETVDPIFAATIVDLVAQRGKWLLRRQDVRKKVKALAKKEHVLYDIKQVFPASQVDGRL